MQDWEREFLALFGEHERAREYAKSVRNAKKTQAQRKTRKKVLKKALNKKGKVRVKGYSVRGHLRAMPRKRGRK